MNEQPWEKLRPYTFRSIKEGRNEWFSVDDNRGFFIARTETAVQAKMICDALNAAPAPVQAGRERDEVIERCRELLRCFHGYHYTHEEQQRMIAPLLGRLAALKSEREQ